MYITTIETIGGYVSSPCFFGSGPLNAMVKSIEASVPEFGELPGKSCALLVTGSSSGRSQ